MNTSLYVCPGYTIRIGRIDAGSFDFEIFKISAWDENEKPVYTRKGADGFDPVESLDDAMVECSGTLRFDGCMHWTMLEQVKNYAGHFCGRADMRKLADAFDLVYDLGPKLMPDSWRGDE